MHPERSITSDLLLAAAASLIAGGATLLAAPVVSVGPEWTSESVLGAVTAFVWMAAALLVTRTHHRIVAPVVFGLGASVAWVLTCGIVHSVSPYYGLAPFAGACAGGWGAWSLMRRRSPSTSEKSTALALPVLTCVIACASALVHAPLAYTRWASLSPAERGAVSVVTHHGHDAWYVLSEPAFSLVSGSDSLVRIELDPHSGDALLRAAEVVSRADRQRACLAFQSESARMIESEIARGAIPALVRLLPIRYSPCESGRLWVARVVNPTTPDAAPTSSIR